MSRILRTGIVLYDLIINGTLYRPPVLPVEVVVLVVRPVDPVDVDVDVDVLPVETDEVPVLVLPVDPVPVDIVDLPVEVLALVPTEGITELIVLLIVEIPVEIVPLLTGVVDTDVCVRTFVCTVLFVRVLVPDGIMVVAFALLVL